VQGIARQFPVASSAVLLAHFSLAGLPLLAGFPVLSSLWVQLAAISVPNVVWCFLGSVGLMVGGFRSLAVMVMGPEVLPVGEREGLIQWIFLMIGIFGLFLFGFFPQWIYPLFSDLVGSLGFFSP
jgi:formate hydrogenlyase subunit 3/multisubunit Na+/H+ antiporter MnhD subunit